MIDPSDTFLVFLKTIAWQFTAVLQLLLVFVLNLFNFAVMGKRFFFVRKKSTVSYNNLRGSTRSSGEATSTRPLMPDSEW